MVVGRRRRCRRWFLQVAGCHPGNVARGVRLQEEVSLDCVLGQVCRCRLVCVEEGFGVSYPVGLVALRRLCTLASGGQ